jgi:hypothetical protein
VQYRLRINAGSGDGLSMMFHGLGYLRLIDGRLNWSSPPAWEELAPSTSFRVGGDWVVVTVLANKDESTYFENGNKMFTLKVDNPAFASPVVFRVVGSNVDVELSNVRYIMAGDSDGQ